DYTRSLPMSATARRPSARISQPSITSIPFEIFSINGLRTRIVPAPINFMKTKLLIAVFVASFSILHSSFAQCSLTPPGAPAPTMRTLDQLDAKLEKRTPISSVPYIINDPGSYYLTTNLTGVASQYGIAVLADNVTIDLNGFALNGINNAFTGIGFFGQKN